MRNPTAALGFMVSLLATGCSLPICEEVPGLCGPAATEPATTYDGSSSETAATGDEIGETEADSGSEAGDPPFCGGIAGFPCPDGLVCVDDPNDDCDPLGGGADCGGLCVERNGCDAVLPAFRAETQQIRSCEEDAECGQVLTGTSCGCTRNWVARLDADLSTWTALYEEALALECEVGGISTCDCPQADGFACVDRVCTWNYLATRR